MYSMVVLLLYTVYNTGFSVQYGSTIVVYSMV